jgi:hypothetical protein
LIHSKARSPVPCLNQVKKDKILPTEKPKNTAMFLFQLLSNLLQPIGLFRYDSLNQSIFLISGRDENLEITIFEDGSWEFNADGDT